MAYSPSNLVEDLHDIRRYGSDLGSVTNVFNIQWDTPEGKDYLEGVLMQAAGFWGLAALTFLVFGIALLVGCISGSRCRGKSYGAGSNCCQRSCGPRCTYMTAATLIAVTSCVAAAYTATYVHGITQASNSVQQLSGILRNSSSWVNGDLLASLSSANASALSLVSAAQPDANVQAAAQALYETLTSAVTTVDALGEQLSSTSNSFTNGLGTGGWGGRGHHITDDDVDNDENDDGNNDEHHPRINLGAARSGLSIGLWCLVGVSGLWLLLQGVCMRGNKCSARLFRTGLICTLGAGSLVMVLTGFLYLVGMVASDVCVAPAPAIASILNATRADAQTTATVTYYATCAEAASVAPAGAYEQALSSSAQLTALAAQLPSLQAAIAASTAPASAIQAMTAAANSLSDALGAANGTAALVSSSVACAPVSSTWYSFLNAACGDGIRGDVISFIALAAQSGLYLLLLSAATALAFHHPGDDGGARAGGVGEIVLPGAPGSAAAYGVPAPAPATGLATKNPYASLAPAAPARGWTGPQVQGSVAVAVSGTGSAGRH